jgi:hypothetical protein
MDGAVMAVKGVIGSFGIGIPYILTWEDLLSQAHILWLATSAVTMRLVAYGADSCSRIIAF